jgi:hypothetical protein
MSRPAGPSSGASRKRPWWQWVIGGFVLLIVLTAIFGNDGKSATVATTVTVTRSVPAAQARTTAPEPSAAMADARDAADRGNYGGAVAIAAGLGAEHEAAIRRRIANRIARQVRAAVRAGDRSHAKALLARAKRFPSTSLARQARASYRAAKARAAERALARRAAAEQRRLAEAQLRRGEQAAKQVQPDIAGSCDPNYSGCVPPYPPDVNCPQVAGPVQVVGSDPHRLDGDGDGVACE